MVPVVYSARYRVDIGLHVFPIEKYQMVHDRLAAAGVIRPADIIEPQPAGWDELSLVHSTEYLSKIRTGTLSAEEIAQLELPWSQEMAEGFRLMVGGTITAARLACGMSGPKGSHYNGGSVDLRDRDRRADLQVRPMPIACHLGGGLHHAFPSHGEGFCPFNDVAVAVRVLQAEGVERVAIVDLDVHHGNGTAFIFESDPRVFTFSMHQQYNYPLWKPRGSLDIGLSNGTQDATFLRELELALPQVLASQPECVFYLAGADPYQEDQLGGLRLTREGLRRRDRLVIEAVRAAGLPLAITLAGGYARRIEDTVAIHAATIEEAVLAAKTRRHEENL